MLNPILEPTFPIPFHRLRPEHIVPAVRAAIAQAESEIDVLASGSADRTFEGTMVRLDGALSRVEAVANVAEHLVSVLNTPEIRKAHEAAQSAYERFFARVDTNAGLWRAVEAYAQTEEALDLPPERRYFVERALREFRHAGAHLDEKTRGRVEALRVELSEQATRFENHVLDSLNEYALHLQEEDDVAGLPPSALRLARREAESRGLEGWVFTLHAPSFVPFMRHAERRDLRRRIHEAYYSVASAGEHDNRPVISTILALRAELAERLERRDFADYVLELNMVGSASRAQEFVELLTSRTEAAFRGETKALEAYARTLGIDSLEPWDVHFVAERLRRERYEIDEELLRAYFPLGRVLEGLFEVAGRLFGVDVREKETEAVWHPDVRYFELRDEEGVHRASFYLDLHPRPTKRGGAWKATLRTGGPLPDGGFEPHLLTIGANFTPPSGGREPLLAHGEVETLFHEFGHLLHGALSTVELRTRSGTKVPRDFVELPSQIMENWCWEADALPLFSRHERTGEPIPVDVLERLRASRDFRSASAQMRQLGFGAIDLDLHTDPPADPLARTRQVLARYALRPHFARDSFLCSFTHIFAGGYAAAYHSYKWSEMLDADAFTRFRQEGLLSRSVGEAFVRSVLSRGMSAEPSELYREFMGRDPVIEPLLARTLPKADRAA